MYKLPSTQAQKTQIFSFELVLLQASSSFLLKGVPIQRLPITLNAGVGTGSFYSVESATAGRDNQFRPFFGIGFGIVKNLSWMTDYATQELNTGVSYGISVFKLPVSLSAGWMNVTSKFGHRSHFQLSAAVAYQFA